MMYLLADGTIIDRFHLYHGFSERGGRSAAEKFSSAWDGRFAPGMAHVTASNINIQRKANCVMLIPAGQIALSSSTAFNPVL